MKSRLYVFAMAAVCLIGIASQSTDAQIFRMGHRYSRGATHSYAAPTYAAPTYAAPTYVTPTYVTPSYQTPQTYVAPHSSTVTPTKSQLSEARVFESKSYGGKKAPQKTAYRTQLRHVYRPIKDGPTKKGANGVMLVLAEYIGTHFRSEDEKSLGDMQDLQHGSLAQKVVSTSKGVKMWKEPFLDGTLRYVPLTPKKTGNQNLEVLNSIINKQK